ncbi:MAG TPA: hypothetical protein VE135_28995 [Pyrinomonadaceae bacterium]|nr:hypothetical protein [Pyrinomonadaceae bacterium]
MRALIPILIWALPGVAQSPYPKEIRGYKVERAAVEIKRTANKNKNTDSKNQNSPEQEDEQLIRFGSPQLASVTPLGITFELPIVVAPVKQKGHVDFLVFEGMSFNDTPVEIDEYQLDFDLPNNGPLTLSEPLSVYIFLPRALLAAVDDWNESKKTWVVTGRVYVFGKFKKSIFNFKRCIPVELRLTMPNPLRT